MTSLVRSRLPLTVSLPLFVAVAMFLVAVGTTQLGVMVLRSSNETALRDQAVVFLDAVAGNVAAELGEADAPEAVRQQLAASLTVRTALLEEAMAARWTDREGQLRTVAIAPNDRNLLIEALDEAQDLGPDATILRTYPERSILLVLRTYEINDLRLDLAATFDRTRIDDAASVATGVAVGIDIIVAIFAALAAYVITRRALAPLDTFIERLAASDEAGKSHGEWRRGDELRKLEAALALREKSEAQRVEVMEQMAQQERDALLARMAASIAHEVRNPLAGLKNGISTLRRFGDRPDVRGETLDFLERGLDSIGRVVDVTLSTYRRRSGQKRLSARDVRDLELLIGPEARRAGITLEWDLDDTVEVVVDADALRQILINLLLNAVRASPPDATVSVALQKDAATDTVSVSVSDEGQGMSSDLVAAIVSGKVDEVPMERSIGIWVVASLVERIGADISIRSKENAGTTVRLTLPSTARSMADA
jgi:signal transduction histidine kinase